MPSGRVHNLINIAAYSVLAGAVLVASRQDILSITPSQALYFTLAFAVGTFLLSPDLDLAEGKVDSKRHWGVLGVLWVPYGMLFSHRGLSHTWLVGPLTRLAYLAALLALIVGLLRYVAPSVTVPAIPQPISVKVVAPLIAGYYLSQWLHLIADGVRPDHGMRRGLKKLRRR
ncbi:metal-binding protein [Deinococcus deserti]|uniref:metal-binding protein n=1 Tax=Deinococcus deserti TaxID=310783 RepID=UPI0018787417|nr:metal-binding protein [Deinococcus deserti]